VRFFNQKVLESRFIAEALDSKSMVSRAIQEMELEVFALNQINYLEEGDL